MRLGGPIFGDSSTPESWIQTIRKHGYRAAVCPLSPDVTSDVLQSYVKAAREADILIAEVGAWSNPLDPDPQKRRAALEKCKAHLELAERCGARSCVNIAGSRGEIWDGPHADNFSAETFEMIVQSVREIIDAVQPKHTFYALETMPWIFPDSPDSYLRLIEAIERPQFAVHLDAVNMICSPQRFFDNASFIRECFAKLGPYLKSCHAKDIALASRLTVHLDEVRPGLGGLDYHVFLSELAKLDANTPIMLEHLPDENEYALAAAYVRKVGAELGLDF